MVGAVIAFLAGLVAGHWLWTRWIPALRAYLHARWVGAVRAAVATLPPKEREALLFPRRLSYVEWDIPEKLEEEKEEEPVGGGQ